MSSLEKIGEVEGRRKRESGVQNPVKDIVLLCGGWGEVSEGEEVVKEVIHSLSTASETADKSRYCGDNNKS